MPRKVQIPTPLKIVFWICWWLLLIVYVVGGLFMDPVYAPPF